MVKQHTHQFRGLDYYQELQSLAARDIINCYTYIPSFSNVEALGLLRLFTNVSSLNDDGIVPLQLHCTITVLHHWYSAIMQNDNTVIICATSK